MPSYGKLARRLARLFLSLVSLGLMLTACNNEVVPEPPVSRGRAGFEFLVDPQSQTVTLIANEASTLEPQFLPSDTRILVPDVDIALRNYNYGFLRGNRLIIQTRFKNITERSSFYQPFFFTLNTDTENIKSATAPLVMDKDLGGDGVLSANETTSHLTFEVRHKGKSFTFFVDASAVVQEPVDRIAFRDGEDVYVMNADGTNQTRLTTNNGTDSYHHVWSPDGNKLAYICYNRGDFDFDLRVMNADGSENIIAARDVYYDFYPTWSPDSTKIAHVASVPGAAIEILVVSADGTELTYLPNDPALDYVPDWSPTSNLIAFTKWNNEKKELAIYVIDADGTNETKLTDFGDYPVWSPDGTRIAFTGSQNGNTDIYVMNADGSGQMRLTTHPAIDYGIAWSPDSTKIAFQSNQDGDYDIFVMNADGTNQRQLTHNQINEYGPDWSPDGSKLAFWRRSGEFEVFVMNADGTNEVKLAEGVRPKWQPVVDTTN